MARRGLPWKSGHLIDFTVEVAGLDAVQTALFQTEPKMRKRVRDEIERQAKIVAARASAVELVTMARPRRGRLARGMTYRIRETEQTISALVWNKVPYFWMMSQGSPKSETLVQPFMRRVKSRDRRARYRLFRDGKRLRRSKLLAAYTEVSGPGGAAFHRKVNVRKRPFLASAWAAVSEQAEASIVEAVRQAAAEVEADMAGGLTPGEGI